MSSIIEKKYNIKSKGLWCLLDENNYKIFQRYALVGSSSLPELTEYEIINHNEADE